MAQKLHPSGQPVDQNPKRIAIGVGILFLLFLIAMSVTGHFGAVAGLFIILPLQLLATFGWLVALAITIYCFRKKGPGVTFLWLAITIVLVVVAVIALIVMIANSH